MQNSEESSQPLESKSKRGISVRLDQGTLATYEKLVVSAGLNLSESIRSLVVAVADAHKALDLTGLVVKCSFSPKIVQEIDNFPEHIGGLLVEVTPPAGISIERLNELVFIIPEFWRKFSEPFRIDSAHFHRVADNKKYVGSDRTKRNVLSFRLIDGKWRAGVFAYASELNQAEVVEEIRQALVDHITATVSCYLTGLLPETRRLTTKEVASLDEVLTPNFFIN